MLRSVVRIHVRPVFQLDRERECANSRSKTAQQLTTSRSEISVSSLANSLKDWLTDGRICQLSPLTTEERRRFGEKLLWFLGHKNHESCGLREFFEYLGTAHCEPGGRWGKPLMTKPLRPTTIRTYYTQCRVLWNWMVSEGVLDASPMERIPAPRTLADRIRPFNTEQIEALLGAAKRTRYPKRDEAILLLLLDTGMRASELCSLRLCDVDMDTRSLNVLGKGNKRRTVYIGRAATKGLYNFLRSHPRDPNEPLFVQVAARARARR